MKDKVLQFADWAETHWLALVIYAVLFLLLCLAVVLVSWIYGFWSNGLWGTKFDVNSCWSGVTVIVAGLGGVTALAKAAWTKYNADSQFNTPQGQPVAFDKGENKNDARTISK